MRVQAICKWNRAPTAQYVVAVRPVKNGVLFAGTCTEEREKKRKKKKKTTGRSLEGTGTFLLYENKTKEKE
jgi:hypothetical protein